MHESTRSYGYVGPADIRAGAVRADAEGRPIRSAADFAAWVREQERDDLAEPFTYVVGPDWVLRLAPRRSEHVACAGGARVIGAGEIAFAREAGRWLVTEISNQSTGYCPDPDTWPVVAAAVERAELAHPGGFTHAFVFRRCPDCGEHNVVKEADFVCVFCAGELPMYWNIDPNAQVRDVR